MSWRMRLRTALAQLSVATGFTNNRFRVMGSAGAVLVLAYHRVLSKEERNRSPIQPGMYVLNTTFRWQIQFLVEKFRIIGLDKLEGELGTRGRQKPGVIITFDDGWKDNYRNAYPVLREFGIPALFFIPTSYIGSKRWFWSEKLAHVVGIIWGRRYESKSSTLVKQLRDAAPGSGLSEIQNCPLRHRAKVFDEITMTWKRENNKIHHQWLDGIATVLGELNLPQWECEAQLMNWDEIEEMHRHGMEIGSHSHSHRIMTELDGEEATQEMIRSRKILSQRLGSNISSFAFPNGWATEELMALSSRYYRFSFGMQRGPIYTCDNRELLTRIPIHEDISQTRALFACRLSGLFQR